MHLCVTHVWFLRVVTVCGSCVLWIVCFVNCECVLWIVCVVTHVWFLCVLTVCGSCVLWIVCFVNCVCCCIYLWFICVVRIFMTYVYGDVLWNSVPDSCRQFSHCFWSAFLVFRKMRFRTENAKKRIIQNTPRMGPIFHQKWDPSPTMGCDLCVWFICLWFMCVIHTAKSSSDSEWVTNCICENEWVTNCICESLERGSITYAVRNSLIHSVTWLIHRFMCVIHLCTLCLG